MLLERGNADGWHGRGSKLPSGYFVERDADLLILRRPDNSFVAAFGAGAADPFDVEAAIWEDAN